MGKMFSLLYGLVAYAAAMVTLLYFAGFSGNLVVPKSVDSGASVPVGLALVVDLLLLAAFGLQHSVMARPAFKRWWARLVPPVVERSTFLVASCAALAALFHFWLPITEPVIWRVDNEAGVTLLWSVFALGWLLLVGSSYMLDHWELFGLRQVITPLRSRHTAAPAEFRTPLLYRHIRHPLYLGFLLGLWAVPVMTAGRLLFAAGLSLYILIGIAFEERDLMRQFGERYRHYRRQAGMLLPRWRSSGKA
jgi:protein-S-isoprenylcysteine O-methyltransferase Ste14